MCLPDVEITKKIFGNRLLLALLIFYLPLCTLAAPSTGSFPAPSANFDQYRQAVFSFISRNPLPGRSQRAIRLNLPFEVPADTGVPYRGRFLLIHGLSDSPYVWHDTAQMLTARGFDVRAILLPGHGTTPEDMLNVSYTQWLEAADEHFRLYDDGVTPIYLGGFSLGGILATELALDHPNIAGLLLFSPAYRSKLDHYLRWAWLYAKFKPWLFGGMLIEDNPIKYNSIPINSGTQFYRTSRYLERNWNDRQLAMPVLVVATEYDSVVDIDNLRNLFQRHFVSAQKRLLLYNHDPELTLRTGERQRPDQFPQKRILNQSHLSLMNAPSNPLFGESGNVLICNGNEYPIFMACMRATDHWFGAQHTPSPDGTPVARTTYNPDFSAVFDAFDEVFGNAK